MKKRIIKETYAFDNMTIIVLIDETSAEVYFDGLWGLLYVFSVSASDYKQIDIDALHENGYFDAFLK